MNPTHYIVAFIDDNARPIGWLNKIGGISKSPNKSAIFETELEAELAIEDSEVDLEPRIEGTTIGK